MSKAIDRERFVALLNERFPEVAAQIDDISEGLLHLEMATFSRATQAAIDSQDEEAVKRHFRFIDEVFRDAAPDVENAVNVSYLEHLRFEGRKAGPTKARGLLPPRLHQALIELEEYLANLHGGSADA
ncbi:MAG: hypothetical protein P4L85_27915 [Paludisphaera borealis]|uniref:DUF7674 family protein n=1 Tax=Paludisphaera borealis TaxID=1387353 RepID=UPI002851B75F|nr:hypothetical protein [Paludisphaera borealis]MDR3623212.1 hypothetical protein [Paludisphaera borealis]